MKELGGNGVCLDIFGSIGQSTDNRVIISSFRSSSVYPVPLQTQQQLKPVCQIQSNFAYIHSLIKNFCPERTKFCILTFCNKRLCFNVLQQNVVFQHFAKCSLNSTGRPNMCIIF